MSRDEIIIVGARGMGRELLGYCQDDGIPVKGFLDGGVSQEGWSHPVPILGNPEEWAPAENERFIVALGEAKWRKHYVDLLTSRGVKFATFISKKAYIGPNVTIGEGAIIAPTAVVTADVVLGKHAILNIHTSISHDCVVGDYVTLSPGSRIPGRCKLNDAVFLGVNASLLPDIHLADGTQVGAGAVVTKSIASEGKTLVGVPARVI